MAGEPPRRRRPERPLTDGERADWEAIARSITPLPKRAPAPPPVARPAPEKPPKAVVKAPAPSRAAVPAPVPAVRVIRPPPRLPAVEPKVLRALKRRQIEIEARLDLHGETQASAHLHLDRFLATARARGTRIVLVVTGKGKDGDGVLRRLLPHWLGEPPYAEWILGVSPAGPAHGGTGAYYVVLRRAR